MFSWIHDFTIMGEPGERPKAFFSSLFWVVTWNVLIVFPLRQGPFFGAYPF